MSDYIFEKDVNNFFPNYSTIWAFNVCDIEDANNIVKKCGKQLMSHSWRYGEYGVVGYIELLRPWSDDEITALEIEDAEWWDICPFGIYKWILEEELVGWNPPNIMKYMKRHVRCFKEIPPALFEPEKSPSPETTPPVIDLT